LDIINKEIEAILNQILYVKNEQQISDAEFERKLGLKPKTLSDWKRNHSKAFIKILPQIAEALNVTVDHLRGIERPPAQQDAQPLSVVKQTAIKFIQTLSEDDAMKALEYITLLEMREKQAGR
jgi:transcriptional regulator with XRE-family HTH domain